MLVFSQNICASFSLGRGLSHTFSNLYFGSKLIHEPKMLFSFFCSASRRHWTSHFLLKHGIIFVLFVHEGGEPTSNSYMIVNSKVTSLLLMAGLVTYVQPLHHQTRMGGGGGWILYLPLRIIQSMNPLLSLFFLTPPLHCYQRETESIWCHKSSCQTRRSTFQIESEASPNAYRWCLWCQLCWNSLPVLETSPSCSPLLALSLCAVISEAGNICFLFICTIFNGCALQFF